MRKIFVILLVVFFMINIVAAAFLFVDLQVFKAPIINVELDPLTFSPDNLVVQATIHITNPNPFTVAVKNFKIISSTRDGHEVGQFYISGDTVPANGNKTFIAQDTLGFAGHAYTQIKNKITTDISISILGIITKTIPFEMTVDASLANVTDALAVPSIHLQVNLDNIIQDGVHFSGDVEVFNPNHFALIVENLSVQLKNEDNVNLGVVHLEGGTLDPAGMLNRPLNGTLLFTALDARSINATVGGVVGATVAGITKTLPFSLNVQVGIPDFRTLLEMDGPFMFNLTGNFKVRLRGIVCFIDFSIYNPSKIPLDARDFVCSIYRLDRNTSQLLGRQNMSPCTLEPKQEECLSVSITIPYRRFLFSGAGQILPDWLILTINCNISLSGMTRSLPIQITGYLQPHFIFNATAIPSRYG